MGQYNISGVDLQVGMYIKNGGKVAIPVYVDAATDSGVMLQINPGELIGQIHDFKYADGENWVIFSSSAITSANPWYDKIIGGALFPLGGTLVQYVTDRTTSLLSLYGAVRLNDLQGIPAEDIQKQADMLAADPNGTNSIKAIVSQTMQGAGKVAGAGVKGLITGVTEGTGGGGLLMWGGLGLLTYLALTRGSYAKGKGFSYKG